MASTSTDRIEGVSAELAMKAPVVVATTGNITLTAAQTINGVAVVAGDRVLVKDQTDNTENGVYTAQGTAWTRAKDFDGSRDVTEGTLVFIQGGTVASKSVWRLTTTGAVVPGASAITFELAQVFAADAGGFLWQFDSSIVGGEDPGTGDIRFNNATIASATNIVVSNETADAGSPDVSAYVVTWDDSTSGTKGVLTIKKLGAPENFAVFNITGTIIDSEEYLTIQVTNVDAAGTFTAGDNLVITFTPTGNAVTADLLMTWETTTTDTDQGDGKVWSDNSTPGSAAVIFVDDVDNNATSLNSLIDSWDDSTNLAIRGQIKITKNSDAAVYIIASVSGVVTSASTYSKVAITPVISAGTLADGDVVNVQFIRSGDRGVAAINMLWESTTTDTDQGVGKLWLNNGTIASATVLYMDDVDNAAGTSINSQVDTWDDSTNLALRGTITFTKETNRAVFATFNVTGAVTSASTYSKIAVAHVTSAGSFTDGDEISVQFVRSGDRAAATTIAMLFESLLTDTDQGAGKCWFNNATIASATVFYMDDVDNAAGTSINSQVDTWDDSTNLAHRGTITVTNETDRAIFATFNVTGVVTSASTYSKIAITPVTNAGSFTDGDEVSVQFVRSGDRGVGAINMLFETTTTDTDQGAGKLWLNNGTVANATVLYMDDVDNAAGTSINSQVDTWDDSTHTALRGTITFTKEMNRAVFATFNVTGAVTSASTYSKVAVTHVTSSGSFADGDEVSVQFVRTGDAGGGMGNVVEDLTPQLGGFLATNSKFVSFSQGANIASVAGDTNIWTAFDGNTVHITGTNAITDFGTPKQAGDSMWVIFDAAASVVDSATITVAGNTNFQAAANDLALVYALSTSTFLFVPFKNDGTSTVASVVSDTTPQLGGFLDANSKFISQSQGANIASVAGDTDIWANYDGNTVHITGTNAITDFGTPKSAGDHMWVIFDGAASVVDSATITVDGNTNFQAAANDLALVYALTTSTFLFKPMKNDGTATVAAAGAGMSLVSSQDASSDAVLDFTLDASKYDNYLVTFANVIPVTDAVAFHVQTSSDGGSSFETSAYAWTVLKINDQSTTFEVNTSRSDSVIQMIGTASAGGQAVGSAANEIGVYGVFWLMGPHLTGYTHFKWEIGYANDHIGDDDINPCWGAGNQQQAEDVDAIRFKFSSGSIETGTINLYGMSNA